MLSLTSTLLKTNTLRISGLIPIRNLKMKIRPYARIYESMHQKCNRRKLPISPVGIYKPQLTTVISITHRFSGATLAGYSTLLGLNGLLNPNDFSSITTVVEGFGLGATGLLIMKFFIAFPFAYHFCCGIRQLTWATARFLTIKDVYMTGYAAVAGSVMLTGLLVIL